MQISKMQFGPDHLAALGMDAVQLLRAGNYSALGERFGYVFAFERDPAFAIQEALASCLTELQATGLAPVGSGTPKVSYFQPNDSTLIALVEIWLATDNGKELLVELVVTGDESNRHITLEEVSVPVQ